jgi:hypothetical protein
MMGFTRARAPVGRYSTAASAASAKASDFVHTIKKWEDCCSERERTEQLLPAAGAATGEREKARQGVVPRKLRPGVDSGLRDRRRFVMYWVKRKPPDDHTTGRKFDFLYAV